MSYLDRPAPPKGPPWAHNSVGASVHNALAAWWRLPLPRRTAQAAGGLVTAGLDHRGVHRRRAVGPLPRLGPVPGRVVHRRARPGRRAGRRGAHGRDPDRQIAVSGRIDRLDARPRADGDEGTELVVVDYKTGRAPAVGGRRAQLAGAGGLRAGRRPVTAPRVPPGRAAPPAVRAGAGLGAHAGVTRAAPAPGRGHRRRVRGGRRADARAAAAGGVRRGLPAAPRPAAAAGATTSATARRASGPPPSTARGTRWPICRGRSPRSAAPAGRGPAGRSASCGSGSDGLR